MKMILARRRRMTTMVRRQLSTKCQNTALRALRTARNSVFVFCFSIPALSAWMFYQHPSNIKSHVMWRVSWTLTCDTMARFSPWYDLRGCISHLFHVPYLDVWALLSFALVGRVSWCCTELFQTFSARLFLSLYHPHNRKTNPWYCSRQLFIQRHGWGSFSVSRFDELIRFSCTPSRHHNGSPDWRGPLPRQHLQWRTLHYQRQRRDVALQLAYLLQRRRRDLHGLRDSQVELHHSVQRHRCVRQVPGGHLPVFCRT